MIPDGPREEDLFEAALALASDAERAAFLDHACGGDECLRSRIDGMLRVAADARAYFATPADEAPGSPLASALPADAAAPTEPSAGGDLGPGSPAGAYRLIERIGEGGFGDVYVAEQTEPVRRRVALKILKPGMDSRQVIARFEAERQALALMDHPHIARVLDAGTTGNGRPYFVMELVRGIPITRYCDENRLEIPERLTLFIKVCHAIQHAHQKGIIHRDIKPSNILVSLQDGEPAPKVIDFGIAKATQGGLTDHTVYTHFHQFLGTPAYMSPEQAGLAGLDIDTRSDVYALGVLLYELLVACTPFEAHELLRAGVDEMRRTLREREPPRPSTRLARLGDRDRLSRASCRGTDSPRLARLLRGDLDWIVMKCLEKDRARRYPAVTALAADLQRFLNNEPILARPPSRAYRFLKAWRRNRILFSAGSVVLAVLIGAVVVTSRLAANATRASAELRLALGGQEAQRKRADAARQSAEEERRRAEEEKWATVRQAYPKLMRQAQQAWDNYEYERLREILTEAEACPDHGFEWFHWRRRLHLEETTIPGHPGGVTRVAYRPDGRQLASAGRSGNVKIWDPGDGRELRTLRGHTTEVTVLLYSPDSRRLVTAGPDRTLRSWDAEDGRELLRLEVDGAEIRSAAIAPGGDRVVGGCADRTLRLWQLSGGREILRLRPQEEDITALAFTPDGLRIISGGGAGTVRTLDARTGRDLLPPRKLPAGVVSMVISPDGGRLGCASADNVIRILDIGDGKELLQMQGHGREGLTVLALSRDGRRLLSASRRRTVRVWDFGTGQDLLSLEGLTGATSSAAISPDGNQIASGGEDGMIRLRDVTTDSDQAFLPGHDGRVSALVFTPDSRQLISAAEDGLLRAVEPGTARQARAFTGHAAGVTSVAVSSKGERFASGSGDRTVRVWETASGRELLVFSGHVNPVTAVAFSPEDQRICSGSADGKLRIWAAATGVELSVFLAHASGVSSVAYLPDGRRLVTAGADGMVRVWDAESGRQVGADLFTQATGEHPIAVSSDGRYLGGRSDDLNLMIWELGSDEVQFELAGHQAPVAAVAFSPDGRRLVSGSSGPLGTLRLWDAATGWELLHLRPHVVGVSAVAFSPDGRWLASGGEDGSIRAYGVHPGADVPVWPAASGTSARALPEHPKDSGP